MRPSCLTPLTGPHSSGFGIPRCVGCSRCTWRACNVQREEPGYSLEEASTDPDADLVRELQRGPDSGSGLGILYDDQRIAMHHGPVVPGAQLGGKVPGAAAQ
jgi:hypothetical protein